jgi:hypothetical protein
MNSSACNLFQSPLLLRSLQTDLEYFHNTMYGHIFINACLGKKHSGLSSCDGPLLYGFKCSTRCTGLMEGTVSTMSSQMQCQVNIKVHSSLPCLLPLAFFLNSVLWLSLSLRRWFDIDVPFRANYIQLSLIVSLCSQPLDQLHVSATWQHMDLARQQ